MSRNAAQWADGPCRRPPAGTNVAAPRATKTRKPTQAGIIGGIAPPAYHRRMPGHHAYRRCALPDAKRSVAR